MSSTFQKSFILRLCSQPRSFEFISSNCSGLDPISVNGILGELTKEGRLKKRNKMWSVTDGSKSPTLAFADHEPPPYLSKYMGHFDFLQKPHPLDFEWRNSKRSLNYLTKELQKLTDPSDSVLILGMPTLFANISENGLPQRITLVERNKPIIAGLQRFLDEKSRIREADIFLIEPGALGKFDCVFMDPPWYPKHFRQFVWLAAQCLKIGGTLAISIPPLNTRPDVDIERLQWLQFCQQQGLGIENLYANRLEYTMPFFEFNAVRAAGIEDILPFWRKGDFLTLKKMKDQASEREAPDELLNGWTEREFESVRFRVKLDKSRDAGHFSFKSLIKGDILDSVSTREPYRSLRDQANLWTSGNRIYKISNPGLFLDCIDKANGVGKTNGGHNEIRSFISEIANLEKQEYSHYLDWIYYEMERQIT